MPKYWLYELMAQGEYPTVYRDAYALDGAYLYIVNRKFHPSFEGHTQVSSAFLAPAGLEEFPVIWDAVRSTWNNRGAFPTNEELRAAMDLALCSGGYGPPGSDCIDVTMRRYQLSWAAFELPSFAKQYQLAWAELEVPDLITAPRRYRLSWAEFQVPEVSARYQLAWAEFEVPDFARRYRLSWAEFQVPDVTKRYQLSWAEFQVPDFAKRYQLSWAALEVPDAPRRYQLSYAAFEVPDEQVLGEISLVGVGASVFTLDHTTNLQPPLPSGVEAGDIIYVVTASRSGGQPVPTSTGYTQIADAQVELGGSDASIAVLRRVAGPTEDSPVVDITGTSPSGWSAVTYVLRGVDNDSPEDVAFTEANAATAVATFTTPTITPVTNGAWVLSVVATADDNVIAFNNAQGFTLDQQQADNAGNDHTLAIAHKGIVAAAAVTGPTYEVTVNGPNESWVGVSIAVRPGTAGVAYPAQPAAGTVYWGATIQGNSYNSPRVAEHQTASGALLGLHRSFFQWTHRTGYMITDATGDLSQGRLPWVSIKTPEWSEMASGLHDSAIDAMLTALDNLNGPVWLSVHHEPEGGGPGGNVPDFPSGPTAWLGMQAKIRDRMTALGTDNIAFGPVLMSYTWETASGRDPEDWWQDGIFDFLGVDHYNVFGGSLLTYGGSVWQEIRDWAEAKGVDIGVAEWATMGSTATQAGHMQDFFDAAVNSHNDGNGARVIALAYFDYDIGGDSDDWTLSGDSLIKFREIMNDPRVAFI